jgi:hypothetical protein
VPACTSPSGWIGFGGGEAHLEVGRVGGLAVVAGEGGAGDGDALAGDGAGQGPEGAVEEGRELVHGDRAAHHGGRGRLDLQDVGLRFGGHG